MISFLKYIKPFTACCIAMLCLTLCTVYGYNCNFNQSGGPVNRIMARVPDSMTYSTESLARYVRENFNNENDRAYATYQWIVRNIKYNFDSIITNSLHESPAAVSARLLKTRNGVCLNIATLYAEIANKTGIKSYVIHGYTKQNGRVDYLPHVWCVSFIDAVWYMIDPTWGSGAPTSFFMASPQKMILTHMPFDPMWQLMDFPVRYDEFKSGIMKREPGTEKFSYNDTIARWEKLPVIEKLNACVDRMEKNGSGNRFTEAKLKLTKAEIVYQQNKASAEKYDSAVHLFNKGIYYMNRFIASRNAHFKTENDSLGPQKSLTNAEIHFRKSVFLLNSIKSTRENMMIQVYKLKEQNQDKLMIVHVQRAYFLDDVDKVL